MSERKINKRGPRGSKAEVEAVKKAGRTAGRDLDKEQQESLSHLARTLRQIDEGEALAHLDTRLTFLERSVERLSDRRDEMDRSVQGELNVMRTRIEEALEAVGATAEESREAWVAIEKRLVNLISNSEKRSAGPVETLRTEVVSKVEAASTRLEKYEARLRGEMSAFEEEAEERARLLAEAISQTRGELEREFESRLQELDAWMERASGDFAQRITAATSAFEHKLAEGSASSEQVLKRTEALEGDLSRALANLQDSRAAMEGQIATAVAEISASVDERMTAAISEAEARAANGVRAQLDSQRTEIEQLLESERRELQGRLSEGRAEMRLEIQRVDDALQGTAGKAAKGLEQQRKELLQRIGAAEEKSAGSTIHLESMIAQQGRQIAAGESEWSEGLNQIARELSELRNRTEELVGRVSTVDARWATEKGSSQVALEGLAVRLDMLEERLNEAVEEIAARQSTRFEMLATQVAGLAQAEVVSEERFGAVEYLKRRVAEMAERMDEMMIKVNAIGRYVTKPTTTTAAEAGAVLTSNLGDRLEAIEKSVAELAELVRKDASALSRLGTLETTVAGLAERVTGGQERMTARVEELERRTPLASTILPKQKKGLWK